MKKTLHTIILMCCVLILTGCNNYSKSEVEKEIQDFFGKTFSIETINFKQTKKGYILEMKADDTIFYVESEYCGNCGGGFGETLIRTSILDSFYQKHKFKIEQIANNNGLNIEIKEPNDDGTFPYTSLIMKANKNQLENVEKAMEAIINISDINKLYNLLYGDGTYTMNDKMLIKDNSKIIIYDGEQEIESFELFWSKYTNDINELK